MRRLVPFALLLVALPDVGLAQRTLIHAGTLIDGIGDQARAGLTIVVENDRIVGVEEGFVAPGEGDAVIDLTAQTVMPGWMDMHTHFMMELSEDSYSEEFFMNEADYALRAAVYAEKTLKAGFTTVMRDVVFVMKGGVVQRPADSD